MLLKGQNDRKVFFLFFFYFITRLSLMLIQAKGKEYTQALPPNGPLILICFSPVPIGVLRKVQRIYFADFPHYIF